MPPVYATRTDFENYVEGWVTDDAAALDRLLERAERDVEALFPLLPIVVAATAGVYQGHRFWPEAMLADYELAALKRAVCAQAEYRFDVGEETIAGATPTKVTGPDFTVEHAAGPGGARRSYSGKLAVELAPLDRFRVRLARARA